MNKFILFLNGFFTERFYVEEFSNNLIEGVKSMSSVKVIIENTESIILFFESDDDEKMLSEKLFNLISDSEIKLSFLFNSESLIGLKIPERMKYLINEKTPDGTMLIIEMMSIEMDHNLDEILEKIEKYGIKSLTKEEKKFLDDFKK